MILRLVEFEVFCDPSSRPVRRRQNMGNGIKCDATGLDAILYPAGAFVVADAGKVKLKRSQLFGWRHLRWTARRAMGCK
jgi:hypothetical protein